MSARLLDCIFGCPIVYNCVGVPVCVYVCWHACMSVCVVGSLDAYVCGGWYVCVIACMSHLLVACVFAWCVCMPVGVCSLAGCTSA